ncbi:T9SS type A sorting domain-containing protein [Aurantibacter aestuarii]|uniref:Secretion system C-terminal sorting domain-containing protein n=1 Tax=Aurantibacter aestuarii TaxID=1266046 RepID=A0A2T1NCF5_9FLAO|nr:T9SS type A sorting domain-containing protein [Aurantibacter aestuarii]PSG90087.1 hypothetical protein C7H52_02085 [Aurantibacter aestuarii]
MKTKLLYVTILMTISFQTSFAQFALGDIVFTGYQSDGVGNPSGEDDQFSFLLLINVVAGEQIAFTENGWLAAGGFRTGESTVVLTFTSNYSAGVQISISRIPFEARDNSGNIAGSLTGSGLNLAVGGDQILAYNPANIPNSNANQSGFVAAIQMNGDWDADATSSSESAKPSIFDTLANSSIAIAPEVDNAIYNCSVTSGTAVTLRAAIHNPANWNVSDATPFDQPAPCSFMATLSTASFTVLDSNVALFPNPSQGTFTIKNSGNSLTKISVADANGRIVYTEKLNNVKTDKTLNLSNKLTTGLYFITISTEGSSIVKKMIVN